MTKVFVIDDSLTVRNGFKKLFESMPDITLIGEAENPVDAVASFKKVGLPDLFILDIEMPKMDGLTFLKQINEQRPTPVIICSTIVQKGSSKLIDALRLGAAEIIEKPKANVSDMFITYKKDLMEKVRVVAQAKINYHNNLSKTVEKDKSAYLNSPKSSKVVAIGCSTGGIQVLEEIITHLDTSHLALLVVQHIPKGFSASLASRLNSLAKNSIVKEVEDGDIIRNNTVFIAPGGVHVEVEKLEGEYLLRLKDFPRVNSHKPSINVLFNSVAKAFKQDAIGFVLTGMGDDGATGLKKMFDEGAETYVQNEQTSTVFGMPKKALESGGATTALSIFEIIQVINRG